MLYEITGTEKDLKPYMFTAHMDVVPVHTQIDSWSQPPFDAKIVDGFIYALSLIHI